MPSVHMGVGERLLNDYDVAGLWGICCQKTRFQLVFSIATLPFREYYLEDQHIRIQSNVSPN